MLLISVFGILSSFTFIVLLIKNKRKSYSDKILLVWMIFFLVHLVLPFMMALGNRFFIEKVDGLDIGFYTLHLAFLYYYALSITNQITIFKVSHLEYFIPVVIVYFIQGIFDSQIVNLSVVIDKHFYGDAKIFHLTGVVILNLGFCLFFTRKTLALLFQHRKTIGNNYSFSEKINLLWLRNLVFAAVVLSLIAAAYLLALLAGKLNNEWINNFYFSSFSIFAVVLGFWGYRQGVVESFFKNSTEELTTQVNLTAKVSQCKDYPKKDTAISKLEDFMKNERPYLDASLNIAILANKLGVHSQQLSRWINEHYNKNFYEFVNDYRVEEFKKLVANPKNKHFSILGLAFDAGFNSKATFNRIFKNKTGQTPSQFRSNFNF